MIPSYWRTQKAFFRQISFTLADCPTDYANFLMTPPSFETAGTPTRRWGKEVSCQLICKYKKPTLFIYLQCYSSHCLVPPCEPTFLCGDEDTTTTTTTTTTAMAAAEEEEEDTDDTATVLAALALLAIVGLVTYVSLSLCIT